MLLVIFGTMQWQNTNHIILSTKGSTVAFIVSKTYQRNSNSFSKRHLVRQKLLTVFASRLNGGLYGTDRTRASVLLARGALRIPKIS